MQLDELRYKLRRRRDLRLLRVNKKTYYDPSLLEARNRRSKRGLLRRAIEAAFCCHFLAIFWDEANILRQNAQGKLNNF